MHKRFLYTLALLVTLVCPLWSHAQSESDSDSDSGNVPTSYDVPPETQAALQSYDQPRVPAAPATVRALPEEPKTFRILVDRPLLNYTHLRQTPTEAGGNDLPDASTDARNYFDTSFLAPLSTFGLSFAVSHNIHLGLQLTLDTDVDSIPGGSFGSFLWQVNPFVEVIFGEEIVRPFVLGTLGAVGVSTWGSENTTSTTDGTTAATDVGLVQFVAGAGGGLHIHPASWFSLDVTGLMLFNIGVRRDGERDSDSETKTRVFNFNLQLGWGASLWF